MSSEKRWNGIYVGLKGLPLFKKKRYVELSYSYRCDGHWIFRQGPLVRWEKGSDFPNIPIWKEKVDRWSSHNDGLCRFDQDSYYYWFLFWRIETDKWI